MSSKPKSKILVDGGDPTETLRVKELIGFVDGQTTNPSLIAKNPDVCRDYGLHGFSGRVRVDQFVDRRDESARFRLLDYSTDSVFLSFQTYCRPVNCVQHDLHSG